MSQPEVDTAIAKLFARLDAVPFAPASALVDDGHKQRFETLITYARRRLSGARYHRRRIDALVAEAARAAKAQIAEQGDMASPSKLKATASEITVMQDHEDAIYELGAMLGAIRSGIDFLVKAGATLLKGMEADSISKFLKWRDHGLSAPVARQTG